MEMPKPGAPHERMRQLAGTWRGEDRLHPSPWDATGATAEGRMTARMALGGFHLLIDWQQLRDGVVTFEGHGVLGWDPRGKCYTLHWFDSIGVEHGAPHLGTWDNDTLTLQHETSHMGHSRQVYRVGVDAYDFRLESSQDGKTWSTFMDGSYRRV